MTDEPNTKSCVLALVKSTSAMARDIEHLSRLFTNYLEEERTTHAKIDAAIENLRSKVDYFVYALMALLAAVCGFLLTHVLFPNW